MSIQRCNNVVQRCFDVVATSGSDVVLTFCNVENPRLDFVSFSTSTQRYFNVDPQLWNNVDGTLKCWLGRTFEHLGITPFAGEKLKSPKQSAAFDHISHTGQNASFHDFETLVSLINIDSFSESHFWYCGMIHLWIWSYFPYMSKRNFWWFWNPRQRVWWI